MFTKFMIEEGRLGSRNLLDPSRLDPEMFSMASDAFTRLKNNGAPALNRIAVGASLNVGLGLERVHPLSRMTPERLARLTEEQRAEFQRLQSHPEELQEKFRKWFFHLRGVTGQAIFYLVPSRAGDTEAGFGGLIGLIGGSWAGRHAGESPAARSTYPMDELRAEFRSAAREIVANRPAVACFSPSGGSWGDFGDCFAAIMLADLEMAA